MNTFLSALFPVLPIYDFHGGNIRRSFCTNNLPKGRDDPSILLLLFSRIDEILSPFRRAHNFLKDIGRKAKNIPLDNPLNKAEFHPTNTAYPAYGRK
jgi:hypothetical protein